MIQRKKYVTADTQQVSLAMNPFSYRHALAENSHSQRTTPPPVLVIDQQRLELKTRGFSSEILLTVELQVGLQLLRIMI